MSLEPDLPFEFVVRGTPVSLGASSRSRMAWRARIIAAARVALPPGYWLLDRALSVTIFIFPNALLEGDIDNRLKPILDAMTRTVYMDDILVERLLVQKFEPGRSFEVLSPSALMREAAKLGTSEPIVYIRVDDDLLGAGL